MAVAGKFVKQLAGSGTGQSMMDRVTAAKHSISGSGLCRAVCKATTEEIIAPKKKHLDYLVQCTNEPNVSIPELANSLINRTQQQSWVVVFKSLISLHNVMNYGNERFTQYCASNNTQFNLQNFTDKTCVQGYDMSAFLRRYAKYINEKCVTYRLMAFDFCKVKRGKEDGVLRNMPPDKLLRALPLLQNQVEVLLEFDATSNELTNSVINAAFLLLFKDLIRLFACYNDGIINLLEKYFEMNKKQCRESLDIYKKFLVRMEKVAQFLRVAESVGVDRGDIPDLAKAPASLLEALEQHLAALEGRKYTPRSTSSTSLATATGGGSSPTKSTSAQIPPPIDASGIISEQERQRILQEEELELQKLKEKARRKSQTSASIQPPVTATTATNLRQVPRLQAAATATSNSLVVATSQPSSAPQVSPSKPSDDLLLMGDICSTASLSSSLFATTPNNNIFSTVPPPPSQPPMAPPNAFGTMGWVQALPSSQSAAAGFGAGFGGTSPSSNFDGFGGILQPQNTSNSQASSFMPMQSTASSATGSAVGAVKSQSSSKLLSNDLDASIAKLAGNLSISGADNIRKPEHQWSAPSPNATMRTGGNTFATPVGAVSMRPALWSALQPIQSYSLGPISNLSASSLHNGTPINPWTASHINSNVHLPIGIGNMHLPPTSQFAMVNDLHLNPYQQQMQLQQQHHMQFQQQQQSQLQQQQKQSYDPFGSL